MTGSRRVRPAGMAALVAGVLGLLLAAPAWSGQGRKAWVDCKLDRERIFEGEVATYQVQVFNADPQGAPEVTPADCDVEYVDSSQFTQSVNGRSTYSTTFRYRITPHGKGEVKIPGPVVRVDGSEIRGPEVTLTVVAPERQDDVVLDLRVEPTRLLPLKPFRVRLRIFVHRLPDRHAALDPLVPLPDPPSLQIPWVDPIAGLESTEWSQWLGAKTSRQRGSNALVGFTINAIQARQSISLFSFGEVPLAVFDLDGRAARDADVQDVKALQGKARDYWVYTLERSYVADAVGRYTFGPVRLKGTFARPEIVQGELRGQDLYAIAPEVTVAVELPAEGRPDSFTGAFGSSFSLEADVTPRSVRVGDPITLTLKISGKGNVADQAPPDLRALAEYSGSFKIYDATAETRDQRRLFTWSLRPTNADVTAVPPVPFSYFDVDREQYTTLHSDPVDIDVEPAVRLDAGDIVAGTPERADTTVQARTEGLFANVVDPRALRRENVRPLDHTLYLGALPFAYLLAAVSIPRWRRRRQDPALLRKRGTLPRARSRLDEGRAALSSGDLAGAAQKMRAALIGPVADAAGVPEAGLTARDVASQLEGLGVTGVTVSGVRDALERWESVQYGVRDRNPLELAGRTEGLLKELSRSLRRGGHL